MAHAITRSRPFFIPHRVSSAKQPRYPRHRASDGTKPEANRRQSGSKAASIRRTALAEPPRDHAGMGLSSATYPQASQPPFPFSGSVYPTLDPALNMADTFQQTISPHLQDAARAASHRNGDLAAISVSRACDECRRKKIKCDSADGPDDGTIRTCTNCAKANMQCDFSRVPMKRGPSKGYIKELSERVEKMESRQAAFGPTAYRRSVEGASITDSLYSTDDPLSAKRHFSFSSDIRQPFEPVDYQHGRGSCASAAAGAGVWSTDFGASSSPSLQSLDDLEQPPPKRQKTDSVPPSIKAESVDLTHYEHVVHPTLPLLPERASAPSDHFTTYSDLLDAVSRLSRQTPHLRPNRENVILMWSCALLAVLREFDVRTNQADLASGSRAELLKGAMDLADHLQDDQEPVIQDAVAQAKTMINVLTRWDWFASGAERNWSKTGFRDFQSIPDYRRADYARLAGNGYAFFVTAVSRTFKRMQSLIQSPAAPDVPWIRESLDDTLEFDLACCLDMPQAPDEINDDALIVRQCFEFVKLLTSAYHARPILPLTVTTLLAFLNKVPDAKTCGYAEEALNKLRPVIERKLSMYKSAIRAREDGDDGSAEGRRYSSDFYGTDADGIPIQSRTWMEALLTMIDKVPREKWAISIGNDGLVLLYGGQAGQDFVEDFMSLVRTGYGRIVAAYGGRGHP
ncbi:hypothetical protein DV737_g1213, partial [Chaetothyriales sp. CBS 132003]